MTAPSLFIRAATLTVMLATFAYVSPCVEGSNGTQEPTKKRVPGGGLLRGVANAALNPFDTACKAIDGMVTAVSTFITIFGAIFGIGVLVGTKQKSKVAHIDITSGSPKVEAKEVEKGESHDEATSSQEHTTDVTTTQPSGSSPTNEKSPSKSEVVPSPEAGSTSGTASTGSGKPLAKSTFTGSGASGLNKTGKKDTPDEPVVTQQKNSAVADSASTKKTKVPLKSSPTPEPDLPADVAESSAKSQADTPQTSQKDLKVGDTS